MELMLKARITITLSVQMEHARRKADANSKGSAVIKCNDSFYEPINRHILAVMRRLKPNFPANIPEKENSSMHRRERQHIKTLQGILCRYNIIMEHFYYETLFYADNKSKCL